MLRASSFRGLNSGSERTGAARVRRPKPLKNVAVRGHSFVPRLETLEDRTVPSGGYVFQTIDPPLAAQVSIPTLINSSGEVVGAYTDANFVLHGYLLSGRRYTTIDDPNAGTGAGQGTAALGINASGTITGAYFDANFSFHGFVLSGGRYTTIDDPNAGTGAFQGTQAGVSNASGTILGVYIDANSVQHGFLVSGGQYTTIDDPNAGTGAGQGTNAQGINASGVIVGYYFDANSVQHGFLLSGGQYTTIDDPAGVLGSGATGLNDHGQVTGAYTDANGLQHGFVLSGGQYTMIDDPAGVLGNQADSINNSGRVVGAYTDANGVIHGYLATLAHGGSGIGSQGAASSRGSTAPLMNAFGSFESAVPALLPPTPGMLSPPGGTPAAQDKPDGVPTLPDVSRIDQVFAEDRWSTAHRGFQPSRSGSEGLPLHGLHDELADDFAGTR
jgi:hypothetical protein